MTKNKPKTDAKTDVCKHCGANIFFSPDILKWVTSGQKWKCKSVDPRYPYPVRAHAPKEPT
jgi:hypothetical protein